MPTRAEYFKEEAEKCRLQAKKATTATAMFTYLDLAEQMMEKARQAELEEKQAEDVTGDLRPAVSDRTYLLSNFRSTSSS